MGTWCLTTTRDEKQGGAFSSATYRNTCFRSIGRVGLVSLPVESSQSDSMCLLKYDTMPGVRDYQCLKKGKFPLREKALAVTRLE